LKSRIHKQNFETENRRVTSEAVMAMTMKLSSGMWQNVVW